MKEKIIIIEDNSEIREILMMHLESYGYIVDLASNGLDGLELCKENQYNLAIVDIMMEKLDGFGLIKALRKFSDMPVIILSAKNEDSDKILGLNIGADDYITKPFNPMEVIARVNALLRRMVSIKEANQVLKLGMLELDCLTFKLTKNCKVIDLTATEYKILKLLMENPNRIYSKRMIGESINATDYSIDDNSIPVHISHIRDKIGLNENSNTYIKNIRGLGYRIENI